MNEIVTREPMDDKVAALRQRVEATAKMKPITAKHFELLSESVYGLTGVLLSPTTLKRLWGYLSESVTPRKTTLDVLARYCGWRDYEDFAGGDTPEVESGNVGASALRADGKLARGSRVRLFWPPSRSCLIEYKGNLEWVVVASEGTRLQPGDTFRCAVIISGEPLYLDNLIHAGSRPGVYVCGRKSGVTFELLPPA